jgi:hypothetical protein
MVLPTVSSTFNSNNNFYSFGLYNFDLDTGAKYINVFGIVAIALGALGILLPTIGLIAGRKTILNNYSGN